MTALCGDVSLHAIIPQNGTLALADKTRIFFYVMVTYATSNDVDTESQKTNNEQRSPEVCLYELGSFITLLIGGTGSAPN